MKLTEEQIRTIQPHDPFLDIEYINKEIFEVDLQGWVNVNKKVLSELVVKYKPKTIIEIGSWKGWSTNLFCNTIKNNELNTKIICIDTWLGGYEHWLNMNDFLIQYMKAGRPDLLYHQFLYNMYQLENKDIVIPLPQTSNNAYNILSKANINAEIIYIDGSHTYNDVKLDLTNYWSLLEQDGILICDDYGHGDEDGGCPEVKQAIDEFIQEKQCKLEFISKIVVTIKKE